MYLRQLFFEKLAAGSAFVPIYREKESATENNYPD